jgi:hypothetical protein
MQVATQQARHAPYVLRLLAPVVLAATQGSSSQLASVANVRDGARRAASSATAQPSNAMALIKELREKSGAPISDVKASSPRHASCGCLMWQAALVLPPGEPHNLPAMSAGVHPLYCSHRTTSLPDSPRTPSALFRRNPMA